MTDKTCAKCGAVLLRYEAVWGETCGKCDDETADECGLDFVTRDDVRDAMLTDIKDRERLRRHWVSGAL